MICAGCLHKNRALAKFCEGCGRPLSRLLPQAGLRAYNGRLPPKRRPTWVRDIAATVSVVLLGAALIAGIVAGNPRWHTIIASWQEGSLENRTVGTTSLARVQPPPARSDALELGGAAAAVPQGTTHVSGQPRAQPGEIPPKLVQSYDPTRRIVEPPSSSQADLQVMVTLLVAQLGSGPAWRAALANANAHEPDSPEFNYWHRVAAAIRGVSTRRP